MKKTLILSSLTLAALSHTYADQVINFDAPGNDYYTAVDASQGDVLNGGELPGNTNNVDLDGAGNIDSTSVVAFGTQYTSGLPGTYTGPTFYGGQQAIRYDAGGFSGSTGFSSRNRMRPADWVRRNYTLNSSNSDYQYADALYFKQEDWSALSTGQVGFGTTEVAFSLSTTDFGTAAEGQIRWLVENNGSFYVSNTTNAVATNTTFTMTGTAAAADSWALYSPTATDLRIPTSGYSTLGSSFENITAVGYVLDVPRFSNGGASTAVGVGLNKFSSDLVVVPEASSFALLSGFLALGWVMARRR